MSLHSGGVWAAWKWWKGRNPSQNVQVVLLFPESQNWRIQSVFQPHLGWVLSQNPAGTKGGTWPKCPQIQPQIPGFGVFKEKLWGRSSSAPLQFSLQIFSCSSQKKNPKTSELFTSLSSLGFGVLTFNPKVSWSPFVFVHLYYYYYFIIIKMM